MCAAENDRLEATKWLVANGANVDGRMAATGWTAMHAASKKGNSRVLEVLLAAGGNKSLTAKHRDFGVGLTVADVTADPNTLKILCRY
jgi:ankyrin repeat protein